MTDNVSRGGLNHYLREGPIIARREKRNSEPLGPPPINGTKSSKFQFLICSKNISLQNLEKINKIIKNYQNTVSKYIQL